MCGIAGFVGRDPGDSRREVLRRMTHALRHRGPDDEGEYIDDTAALGVARLSVIDVATGHQPIGNEDGTIHVVLNGEIYNFKSLRARLESKGHRFRTGSDAEVIVHAYEDKGEACVYELDGMFAFGLWDSIRRTLLLARDRLGEKPLYYYAGPDAFVFGSELRALLECPDVPRTPNLQSLSRYLVFECVPAPHSMLMDVAKLPAGHFLTVSPGSKPRLEEYWAMRFTPDESVTESQWVERLRAQLQTSVRSRLVSDVPLGAFLSGGIDSSTVVALAAPAANGGPFQTFSVGFEEPSYDERRFAGRVAEHCSTTHSAIVFTGRDAVELMDGVGALLDEPLVDASFLPRYTLARAARAKVTVALSGDGGDELFCGYPTYLADRPARALRRGLPAAAFGALRSLVNRLPTSPRYGSAEFLAKQFVRALPYPPAVRTQLLLGGLPPADHANLFSADARRALEGFDPYEELAAVVDDAGLTDPMARLIYHHARFYLGDQTLVAADRATMAAGLEVRAPLLDPALIDLAGRMPARFKLKRWTTKYILKRAVADLVPSSIVTRRKQGLGVPTAAWLRGPLRGVLQARLAPDRLAQRGLFEPTAVARLIDEHVAGRQNHRKVLWALLMFDAWCDHYLPKASWI
jgi:asparagine synthase (glutamine-hydrolysing)